MHSDLRCKAEGFPASLDFNQGLEVCNLGISESRSCNFTQVWVFPDMSESSGTMSRNRSSETSDGRSPQGSGASHKSLDRRPERQCLGRAIGRKAQGTSDPCLDCLDLCSPGSQ